MKRILAIAIVILVLGSLITWRLLEKRAEDAAMVQQRAARASAKPRVSVATAEIRSLRTTFEATGTLEAPLNVKISPKVQGRIDYLTVHEGDHVRKGQVLVRIDASQIKADVHAQEAQLAQAQYKLAQAMTTESSTNVGVKTQIAQQAAGVASAEADYEQVRQNLKARVASAEAGAQDAQGRIDTTQAAIENARASINSARATLKNSQTRLKRLQGLLDQGYVAAQDVDDAKAAVAVQEAGLEVAQGQLRSAQAAHDSAAAQKRVADQQVSIVQTTGAADVEAAHQKLLQAKASLEFARANTAQTPAYRQGIAALKAAVASEQAALASAKSKLADTVLISSLDGYVTSRYMDPGAMASPGTPILAIQFFRQIWVNVAVPDSVNCACRLGQDITVTFDAIPGRTFAAGIVQVNPSADPQARQFTVRAALSNEEGLFRPGMFGHVTFVTSDSGPVVTVPREAVQQDDSGSFVNLVDEQNKIHRQPVTVGPSDANFLGITQGLTAGQTVVTISATPLKEGQEVRTGEGQGGRSEAGGGSGGGAEAPPGGAPGDGAQRGAQGSAPGSLTGPPAQRPATGGS